MPRRIRAKQQVVIPSTALVASSTRYPGKAARIYVQRADWQTECYRHYAICGEARFAASFFGHSVSRAILGTAELVEGKPVTTPVGPAQDKLDELFAGKDGQTQMLDSIGTHLTIAGECYLVGRQEGGGDVWEIVSVMEMQVSGEQWSINYGSGYPIVYLEETDVVIRIWLPNPARRVEADSPFKALLPLLGEIEWLTRSVFSQITSRLAGAGLLMLPQGMSFPPPPEQEGVNGGSTNDADAFMLTLADAMLTPISDPSSPAAQVPIVVTADPDAIDKVKLIHFWSELDSESKELRTEAIRRFALGMDLPPEQILGMSSGGTGGGESTGVSHWGAWQIDEATIKLHIEPMLDVIVNALTMGYLRPALGDSVAIVVYDSSKLRLRPDRSKEAFELWDRGLLTDEALRRENGFSEDDAPQAKDFKVWLLRKLASGSTTPEQVEAAARQLGVDLGGVTAPTGIPREERPPPSLEQHPTRPRTPAESSLLLLAASEPLVYRAMERAGNRLRQTGSRPPNVPSYETHVHVKANGTAEQCLADAWSCAPQVLAGVGADPDEIIPVLNSYCMTLLNEQSPHSRDRLASWLELAGAK